jgi:hypothetical protein
MIISERSFLAIFESYIKLPVLDYSHPDSTSFS